MKQARIVARRPFRHRVHFWYALVEVDGAPLQHAAARCLAGHRSQIDPDERRKALASLHAWADANGWTVVT